MMLRKTSFLNLTLRDLGVVRLLIRVGGVTETPSVIFTVDRVQNSSSGRYYVGLAGALRLFPKSLDDIRV